MNTRRLESLAAVLCVCLVLAGCAARGTRVVLLPQADGTRSAVVVRAKAGGDPLIVSQPYQRATARAGSQQTPTLDASDPQKVRAENWELFDLVPPQPQTFDLFFDVGGTVLTRQSGEEIGRAIQAARSRPGADITVTGYTDTTGTIEHNDRLALDRANDIKSHLADGGFPAERIEAIGRGERELLVPTGDEVFEPRNRRAVIVVR